MDYDTDYYYFFKSGTNTNFEMLSSFVRPLEYEGYVIGFSGMTVLENRDIMLYVNVNYPFSPNPCYKSNVSFLCRYNGEDFGLFSTKTKEDFANRMHLYPNPARDYIRLYGIESGSIKNIKIVDALGNSRLFDSSNGNELDISNLISGTYFVHYQQNGHLITLPFIKI